MQVDHAVTKGVKRIDDAMLCIPFLTCQLCTCRSFVSALLGQLPKLGSLLAASQSSSSSNTNINRSKTVFLQLFGRLLKLDSQLVLDPTQPTFHFMLDSYLGVVALRYLQPRLHLLFLCTGLSSYGSTCCNLHCPQVSPSASVCFCCSCVGFCHLTDLLAATFNALILTPMLLTSHLRYLGILADVSDNYTTCMT